MNNVNCSSALAPVLHACGFVVVCVRARVPLSVVFVCGCVCA